MSLRPFKKGADYLVQDQIIGWRSSRLVRPKEAMVAWVVQMLQGTHVDVLREDGWVVRTQVAFSATRSIMPQIRVFPVDFEAWMPRHPRMRDETWLLYHWQVRPVGGWHLYPYEKVKQRELPLLVRYLQSRRQNELPEYLARSISSNPVSAEAILM